MNTLANEPLQLWLDGKLSDMRAVIPMRVVVTADATCNLKCEHCYWEHDIPNSPHAVDWHAVVARINSMSAYNAKTNESLLVLYAGRTLSKRGEQFFDALLADATIRLSSSETKGIDLSIIDNGYTIFNRPDLLPFYQDSNISVDGWRESHDRQRGKVGSFDVAWGAILKLKEMGYDPITASALGPLTWPDWNKFEELLVEHDIRSSTTFVWDMPATKKREVASIGGDKELIQIFELLTKGVPKLINIYDLDHVKVLMPFLRDLQWSADMNSGDGLIADCNGSRILYRPTAPALFREIEVLWDGSFQTIESCGRSYIDEITDEHLKTMFELAHRERDVWKDVSIQI